MVYSQLLPDQLHIWKAHLMASPIQIATWFEGLSSDEKLRAERFKFSIHRQRFVAARAILRCILARYLNCSPQSLIFGYGKQGKPYLIQPAVNLCFNVAHCNDWAVYALALHKPVGIDIERLREDVNVMAIAKRFFSPFEQHYLLSKNCVGGVQLKAFYHIWVCKEAFIKAIGKGLSFPLNAFRVDISHAEKPCLHSIKDNQVAAQAWQYYPVPVELDYVSTVLIKSRPSAITYYTYVDGT